MAEWLASPYCDRKVVGSNLMCTRPVSRHKELLGRLSIADVVITDVKFVT